MNACCQTLQLLLYAALIGILLAVNPLSAQDDLGQAVQQYEYQSDTQDSPSIRLLKNFKRGEGTKLKRNPVYILGNDEQIRYRIGGGIKGDGRTRKGEVRFYTTVAGEEVLISVGGDDTDLRPERRNRAVVSFYIDEPTHFLSTFDERADLIEFFLMVFTYPDGAGTKTQQIRAFTTGLIRQIEANVDTPYSKAADHSIDGSAPLDPEAYEQRHRWFQAVREQDIETVHSLLKNAFDVNAARLDGRTALHIASGKGYSTMARELIEAGANLNAMTKRGLTPLISAIVNQQQDIFQLLLEQGAEPQSDARSGPNALIYAAWMGTYEMVKALIDRGVDPNRQDAHGRTALYLATGRKRTDVIQLLLRNGANVDLQTESGETALMEAAKNGDSESVEILIDAGADLERTNEKGETALNATRHPDVVQTLVEAGANIDMQDEQGRTPLMTAASAHNVELVRVLLELGASVDRKIRSQSTPLAFCLYTADASDGKNQSVLHVVDLLLDHGANPDATFLGNDRMALVLAAKKGFKNVVRRLIIAGADPHVRTEGRKQAIAYAREKDHPEIARMLKLYMEGEYLQPYVDRLLNTSYEKPENSDDIMNWIHQLKHSEYEQREQAATKLRSLGTDALYHLKRHRTHERPRIRARVNTIIREIALSERREEQGQTGQEEQ